MRSLRSTFQTHLQAGIPNDIPDGISLHRRRIALTPHLPSHTMNHPVGIAGRIMSDKHPEGSNILPFTRIAKPAAHKESAMPQMRELLLVYDELIALLRETDNDGLDALADELVRLVVRYRENMKDGADNDALWEMVKKLKKELREFPQTLRSLLPGIGPRLGESIQTRLGIQFAKY